MTRVAIIPARGGSVRIPRKNIRDFMGKPMMQWPIEAAKASGLFDRIIVSTDDHAVTALAFELDCVIHPRAEDDGSTGTQELAGQILEAWPDVTEACVIYPCSPMLTAEDLRQAWAVYEAGIVGVHPYVVSCDQELQDVGCFYFGDAWTFRERVPLEGHTCWLRMDPARFIDINTESDWLQAEAMFTALRRAHV